MARPPLDEDNYPDPLLSRPRSAAGLWRVVALAAFFILAAVALSVFGERVPPDLILVFLGLLAVVGVFCLFAIAAGLFRFATSDETRTLSRAVVDSLPFGAIVTDREGKISYANAQYGQFAGSVSDGVPVGVTRLFAGQAEASESVYRLSRAARDGRPAVEDIRLVAGEYFAHEGDERALFVVVEGRAEITKVVNGEERVIGVRRPVASTT